MNYGYKTQILKEALVNNMVFKSNKLGFQIQNLFHQWSGALL